MEFLRNPKKMNYNQKDGLILKTLKVSCNLILFILALIPTKWVWVLENSPCR